MARIVVVAQNYAFGPIGKLLTITSHLEAARHEIHFIGEGTAYQLGSREKFDKITKIDTDSLSFEKKMAMEFKNADILLSSMDMSSIKLAQKVGLPAIWLDALFWWRKEIPDYILNVDCYIKQNSVNDNLNLKKYGPKIKNLKSVGPLVELSVLKSRKIKNQVLIAFGGMEAKGWYRVGKESHYPYIMMSLLGKVDFSDFESVIVTGNERIIRQLSSQGKNSKFTFKTLQHSEFIKELANSSLAIMAPGLETPLEAFSYEVPTIFLPPSNASNYMQLNSFIKDGVALMKIHFIDYYNKIPMLDKGFRERLSMYLDQLHLYEKDSKAQKDTVSRLNNYVKDKKLQKQQVQKEKQYILRHKGNGVDACLDIIDKFIKSSMAKNSLREKREV